MNNPWTLRICDQWIAWLTFDQSDEKVNTLNEHSLAELEILLDQLTEDDRLKAMVIRSGKKDSFIAGADIEELAKITDDEDARAKSEAGQEIFAKIEAIPIPTVAVIHGACMGGGLELALACDYRLVTDHPKTILALPEVNLGIIPGWGGTQRLPRLIGLAPGLQMILTGRQIAGKKAYRMGLADGIVTEAFIEQQAGDFINRIMSSGQCKKIRKRRLKAQPSMMRWLAWTLPGRIVIFRQSLKQVMKKTGGHYPAPIKALEVVRRTYWKMSLAEGLASEAMTFSRLACTPISRNLVRLFQATQRVKKAGGEAASKLEINSTAVIGAGIMGGGIAWALSKAGLSVRLKDVSWDALAKGLAGAAGSFRFLVKRRKMSEGEMNLAMHRIAPTIDYAGFPRLDAVIEAVVEDMDLKKKVLRELEENVGDDTIICTNTSSLPLDDLASVLKRPKRFIGLHFFNPVDRMPLVEIIPCRKTSKETVLATVELVKRMGKIPLVVGNCPGFLVNRILLPYLIESAWMFEEGIEIERLDHLLEKFGMPMGPLALVDEVGIDVGYKAAKVLEAAYGERMHVPGALDKVVESGELLGKKNGRGFYLYRNGHKKPNRQVTGFAEQARKKDGIQVREMPDGDIVDRAILIMINEAARCLEEHIVDGPEALDIAMVMGTGFAPFRGGLLRYADDRGVREIKHRLEEFEKKYGARFKPAKLIEKVAGNGGSFYPKSPTKPRNSRNGK
ncbi:MAG: enoyl-CoA hydratase/isomerase family protein [Planctomycetes bacterium]|nr:enoyl-CoA hydratase/isomerase family protein [Planctomycetota bacterium]